MRGRYRGWELPALALGFVLAVTGVVLVFQGVKPWGFFAIVTGMAIALPVNYRAGERAGKAQRKLPPHSEELDYRDGP